MVEVKNLRYTLSADAVDAMGAELRSRMEQWIALQFGERCPDVCEHCPICEAWRAFDLLFRDAE